VTLLVLNTEIETPMMIAVASARIRALAISIAVLSLAVPGFCQAADGRRPNFLLIVADDATWSDFGFSGNREVQTPNLDRLASQGMRLDRMFTPATTCSPTRHALYTGLFPVRNGGYPNHAQARPGVRSMFTVLAEAGYRVGLQGKEHVAPRECFPYERVSPINIDDFEPTREFIDRDDAQPWLLVFASHDPHGPHDRGPPDLHDPASLTVPSYLHDNAETRRRLAAYYAEIHQLDWQVGQLMALLDDAGQAADTLVVFVSEQGSSFPYGGKWSVYDNGIRAASIARWPGRIAAGAETTALLSYVDIPASFLDAAGIDPATVDTGCPDATGSGAMDGRSFLPVLTGQQATLRDVVFAQHTTVGINGYREPYPMRAARDARYKYIRNLAADNEYAINGIHRGKLIESWREDATSDPTLARRIEWLSRRPAEELYDLEVDPLETKNLAGEPGLADSQRRLSAALDGWMEQQGDRGLATELEAHDHQTDKRRAKDAAAARE
jgi:N-sulfoglucosamine sulfohydrolase